MTRTVHSYKVPAQNVGTYAQLPTVRQRWDNPVSMPCDYFVTSYGGGYLGRHAHDCGRDALYVYVAGEEAIAFRCFHHKDDPL